MNAPDKRRALEHYTALAEAAAGMTPAGVLANHPAPWRVLTGGDLVAVDRFSDDCIVDANGAEVIGSSEWMHGEENLPFIVECVNRNAAVSELIGQRNALKATLEAVMRMDVRGHELRDRLQFSDAGRAILAQVAAANAGSAS
jgi:hypothetical protein